MLEGLKYVQSKVGNIEPMEDDFPVPHYPTNPIPRVNYLPPNWAVGTFTGLYGTLTIQANGSVNLVAPNGARFSGIVDGTRLTLNNDVSNLVQSGNAFNTVRIDTGEVTAWTRAASTPINPNIPATPTSTTQQQPHLPPVLPPVLPPIYNPQVPVINQPQTNTPILEGIITDEQGNINPLVFAAGIGIVAFFILRK